jgi:hypothetical protein
MLFHAKKNDLINGETPQDNNVIAAVVTQETLENTIRARIKKNRKKIQKLIGFKRQKKRKVKGRRRL